MAIRAVSTVSAGVATGVRLEVQCLEDELVDLSRGIWRASEVGYREVVSSRLMADFLLRRGAQVDVGVAGLPTAVRATFGSGSPKVAFLAEYDALPDLGHACGHNVIAASACGAAAALAASGLWHGTALVIGCPAEESAVDGAGGKVRLLAEGMFDGVDFALMVHPYDRWTIVEANLAAMGLDFAFSGLASHAAASPHLGRSALDAAVQAYTAIALLRATMPPGVSIQGIFVDGGASTNIVPASAALRYRVRAPDLETLDVVASRVSTAARGAAAAMGCTVELSQYLPTYEPLHQDTELRTAATAAFQQLGVSPEPLPSTTASTDFGNVTQRIPGLELGVQLAAEGTPLHSSEFAEAANGDMMPASVVVGSSALAMTALGVEVAP